MLIGDFSTHSTSWHELPQLSSRDHRCSHLPSKSPSAQFISHSHLRPSLKHQSVNQLWELQWQGPYIYSVSKVTNLTVGDLDPCTQLMVTECSLHSRWKDAPHKEMIIPGKLWLQASWICSLTGSSSTGDAVSTWKFRVWHKWGQTLTVQPPVCSKAYT